MSTVNATNIVADALVGNTSANAITVRGEGSATTSLQQGLGKAWINFNGSGTIATRDSFNISGNTDNGNGDYTPAYTNNFNNNDYAFNLTCCNFSSGNSTFIHHFWLGTDALTTGQTEVNTLYVLDNNSGSGTKADSDLIMLQFHGDLA